MTFYVIRDNETYEPLVMFPAPDSLSASVIMRRDYTNREVHCLSTKNWPQDRRNRVLIEIIANCAATQLAKLPD